MCVQFVLSLTKTDHLKLVNFLFSKKYKEKKTGPWSYTHVTFSSSVRFIMTIKHSNTTVAAYIQQHNCSLEK